MLLLMKMKLTTVMNIFVSAFLIFGTILASILIQEYLYPHKEVDKPLVVTEQIFEDEMNQILSGHEITPKFSSVPVMVWWTPFSGDTGIQDCGKHQCFVTNDREYVDHPNLQNIFFYGTETSEYDLPLPRASHVHWSLLHEESPKNNQLFSHGDMMTLFNHTSTFRRESDLPLGTQYLDDITDLTSTQYYKDLQTKNRYIKSGYAPVVYVQSGCDAPSQRDLWVQEFMKHVQVDAFGSCLHNKELPDDLVGSEQMGNKNFYQLLSRYKFVLSMENAVCQDYVTEKFWRTIEIGSVPIYLGAPNIEDYLPTNKSAILVKDYKSAEEVAKLVHHLNENDQAYEEYLSFKSSKTIDNPWLHKQVDERGWGVSSLQQMEKGNSVKHFQCLVCNRIAANNHFQQKGFRTAVYKADESHYGCPLPSNPITKKIDHNDWYVQDWIRKKSVAKNLKSLVASKSHFNEDQFRLTVREEFNQDFLQLVKSQS